MLQSFQFVYSLYKNSNQNDKNLSKYLAGYNDKTGMKYQKYNLEFFGLCKKCKK